MCVCVSFMLTFQVIHYSVNIAKESTFPSRTVYASTVILVSIISEGKLDLCWHPGVLDYIEIIAISTSQEQEKKTSWHTLIEL